jgi:uncharacterized DUF497 family protein
MDIVFDAAKRAATRAARGLDFADAAKIFAGATITIEDDRQDYGERRFMTAGYLRGRCVVLVWTARGQARRVISMRYTHADEEKAWFGVDRSR